MSIAIIKHSWGTEIDYEIRKLLCEIFVREGYTDPDYAHKEFMLEKLETRGTAFTAIDISTGKAVGVIFYVSGNSDTKHIASKQEAEIHLLAVSPKYRRLGIGKSLINICLETGKNNGVKRMILSTQASMKNASHLYDQMGFITNKERYWPSTTGHTYLVYEKVIN